MPLCYPPVTFFCMLCPWVTPATIWWWACPFRAQLAASSRQVLDLRRLSSFAATDGYRPRKLG